MRCYLTALRRAFTILSDTIGVLGISLSAQAFTIGHASKGQELVLKLPSVQREVRVAAPNCFTMLLLLHFETCCCCSLSKSGAGQK